MAKQVAKLGSLSSHGGSMITATGHSFILPGGEGPVCLIGDMHSCPIPYHGVTAVNSGGSSKTTIDGKPVVLEGALAGCGAVINGGFGSKVLLT